MNGLALWKKCLDATLCVMLAALTSGCARGVVDNDTGHSKQMVGNGQILCKVQEARYPTTAEDFSDAHLLYGHRGFLDQYQGYGHLGRDLVYAQGTAIHPVACGVLRYYGPANGYGTLVAVVEHEFSNPFHTTNGEGQGTDVERFMSIYGHLRKDPSGDGQNALSWKSGDTVGPGDVLGFVQSDAQNGDGPEHLHLGVRLQSSAQAVSVDSAWFRGNDTVGEGTYKKYYADPADFVPALVSEFGLYDDEQGGSQAFPLAINRHPIGTLLARQGDQSYWLVVEDDTIVNVTSAKTLPKKCAVDATDQEIACYWQLTSHDLTELLDAKTVKFEGEAQVYQMYPSSVPEHYRTFLSYDAFLSWGFTDGDIEHRPLAEKSATLSILDNRGYAGFMPGALVKGNGQSEVSVADQHGVRRPLFNWDVFVQLGYDQACIYGIVASTLDQVAGPRSDDLITLADTVECSAKGQAQACLPGTTVPCGCPGNLPGTQSCDDQGRGYGDCVCQGGGGGDPIMCGQYAVGDVVQTPCCPDISMGKQICQPTGVFSECFDCLGPADGGVSEGNAPLPEASIPISEAGVGSLETDAGQNQVEGDVFVRITYSGVSDFANLPKHVDAWFVGHVWSAVSGCYLAAAKDIVCEFHAPHGSPLEFQVSLGANRFWGDTSGYAPAPCIPASQVQTMVSSQMTILGTVKLEVNGKPFAFSLKDNGVDDPNDNGKWCGAAGNPYFNAYVSTLP